MNNYVNKLIPYYESFQNLNKLELKENQLGKPIHIFYILRNPLFEAQKQFEQLYTHPKVPSPKHQLDKHEHTVYNQYKYYKFLLNETSY